MKSHILPNGKIPTYTKNVITLFYNTVAFINNKIEQINRNVLTQMRRPYKYKTEFMCGY